MIKYDVIVLGAGLSGLETAYILSKEGFRVAVLDKNALIGGMIQSFSRKGLLFNTGFNYVASMAKGDLLYRYFSYLDVMDSVHFKQLDKNCFEEVQLGNQCYSLAQGEEKFVENLSKSFPEERENLKKYIREMKIINNRFPLYNLDDYFSLVGQSDYYNQESVGSFLNRITSNKTLQNVLAGNVILYAGQKEILPAYVLSLVNYSFIRSAWRIEGGGSHLASSLAEGIKRNGGDILHRKEVVKLEVDSDNKVSQILCKDGTCYQADKVISSIHPQQTLGYISDSKLKPIYRNRINKLENSVGMFTLYVALKKQKMPFHNRNFYTFKSNDVWCVNYSNWPENYFLYMTEDPKNKGFSESITVMTYMKYDEVKQWENTTVGRRGEDYKKFKQQRAEALFHFVAEKFPDLEESIDSYYSSTPLTYRDYTGSVHGSAYGIIKDCRYPLKTMILPKSRLKNLYFTGQNLNIHGILGTTISSFVVCSAILGERYLMNKVINSPIHK